MIKNQNIFQTPEWEEFKLRTGYNKSYRISGVLVLQKKLPLGMTMLYAPMVREKQIKEIEDAPLGIKTFLSKLRNIAQKNNSIFFRCELNAPKSYSSSFLLHYFKRSFESMQPEHTEVLEIDKPESELLAKMKPKCRYNVKLGEKYGLKVTHSDNIGKELDSFYAMYKATGIRHKITYRSKRYFESLLEILGPSGYARVYEVTAEIEGKRTPLAAGIVVFSSSRAIYLFGSSSDDHKNLKGSHFLQWAMIRDVKEMGYPLYDFFGIAPDEDPSHPWAGVTQFKKQWGGYQVDTLGSYDMIFSPTKYQLFKFVEKIRRH